jgi:hypothetical protein
MQAAAHLGKIGNLRISPGAAEAEMCPAGVWAGQE